MKVSVWDTYVTKDNGALMHFDILVPDSIIDQHVVFGYGKEYLASRGQPNAELTAKQCRFCHVEKLSPDMEIHIRERGYHIIEMSGCD